MTPTPPPSSGANGDGDGTPSATQVPILPSGTSAEALRAVLERLRDLAQSACTEQHFLNVAIRAICVALNAPLGKILELDRSGEFLLVRAGVGWREGVVGAARVVAKPTTQAGLTLTLREPVIFDDLRGTRRFTDALLLRSHSVVSSLSVAIRAGERATGVLSVHSLHRRDYTSAHSRFLAEAAAIIAERLSQRGRRMR